jgi:hypothetical protein
LISTSLENKVEKQHSSACRLRAGASKRPALNRAVLCRWLGWLAICRNDKPAAEVVIPEGELDRMPVPIAFLWDAESV